MPTDRLWGEEWTGYQRVHFSPGRRGPVARAGQGAGPSHLAVEVGQLGQALEQALAVGSGEGADGSQGADTIDGNPDTASGLRKLALTEGVTKT